MKLFSKIKKSIGWVLEPIQCGWFKKT